MDLRKSKKYLPTASRSGDVTDIHIIEINHFVAKEGETPLNAETEIKQSFGFSAIKAMMTPGKKAVLDAVNDLEQHRKGDRKAEFEQALRDRVARNDHDHH